MRGSPVVRTIVIVAVLLLMAVPVWKLTHRAEASISVIISQATPSNRPSVNISLTFAHPASGFKLMHLGKEIWEGKNPERVVQKDFTMDFPVEGIDLELKAQWSDGTPLTAVRVSVVHGDSHIERTVWGTGTLDEVLTFKDSN